MTTFVCIWCKKIFPVDAVLPNGTKLKTKEHIVPACLGGPTHQDNLKDCCFHCNQDRGVIIGFSRQITNLAGRIERWDDSSPAQKSAVRKMWHYLNKKKGLMRHRHRKLVVKEKAILGYSPSENLTFELPPLPNGEEMLKERVTNLHEALMHQQKEAKERLDACKARVGELQALLLATFRWQDDGGP